MAADSHPSTSLPHLDAPLFLTDGGLETTLIFHDGIDLPHFAAFDLMRTDEGRRALRRYFDAYVAVARRHGLGLLLETPTWRASRDWGTEMGYDENELAAVNRESVGLLRELRDEVASESLPLVVSGCVGPRGDGYDPAEVMTEDEAEAYHRLQVEAFRDAGADLVTGITMTNVPEAVGLARAARAAGMPVVVSFTVETDGSLPTGETLGDAVRAVDAATGAAPLYYMVNCAHPTHFLDALTGGAWLERVRGVRANASTKSHAELDEATELDDGMPTDLGDRYVALKERLPNLNVLGGCCGTDHRHVDAIATACAGRF